MVIDYEANHLSLSAKSLTTILSHNTLKYIYEIPQIFEFYQSGKGEKALIRVVSSLTGGSSDTKICKGKNDRDLESGEPLPEVAGY